MRPAPPETDLTVRTVTSFEDPALGAGRWEGLLAASMDPVFLRLPWQRLWWQVKGEGDPILVLAERGEELLAVAPLFAASGILMLVGSGNADSLDFLGRPDGPTLVAVLQAARDAVPQFSGIELYHLPESSPTCALLPGVATALGLGLHSEPVDGAPYADLNDEQIVEQLTSRRSVRKEEARMRRAANLHVREATAGESEELIEIFLRQHGARWREAGHETFNRPGSRELVRAVVEEGLRDGWVSLTVLEWSGAPVAIDISLLGEETQMNWLVSSDPAIRDYSPGRVLQAHVIRAAVAAGKRRYDFGLGEEKYKLRNASGVTMISNWFMYS